MDNYNINTGGTTDEGGKRLLYRLSELDYFEVADKNPDVRGWDVKAGDGAKIGTVHDLIVDPGALKVRYLEISIENQADDAVNDRLILVPIGMARIDKDEDEVIIDKITRSVLTSYPLYDGGIITRAYEHSLRHIYTPDLMTTNDPDSDFYDHEQFDADIFYNTRGGTRGRL